MYGANRLAFGILLVWAAGILFFIAFHPGGIKVKDPDAESGERLAQNPADVLGYLMSHSPGES